MLNIIVKIADSIEICPLICHNQDVIRKISDIRRKEHMENKKSVNITLRPKRQVTLPREIVEQLGISTGDILEITVENTTLIARPRKNRALESLREIQQAFQRSGITEEELQEEGKRIRQEIGPGALPW